MPSGRDPNQTFVTDNARAAKRGILIPLLIVGLLVVGGGLLIAWGLNSFFPGLLGKFPGSGDASTPVAAATPSPTPATASNTEVVAATPVPTSAPTAVPTPVPTAVAAVPPIPTPPSITAVPRPSETAIVAVPTPRPTSADRPDRPDLRVEATPRATLPPAVLPDPTAVPTPPVVARLEPTRTPLPRVVEAAPTAVPRPAAPAVIDTDLRNPENAVIKEEVLKRIDQMPDLTPENRDKLYNRVERTPGMGRVATVFFEIGETTLRPIDVAKLRDELEEGPAKKLLDDPTVVFVVLGYADKTGGIEVNKRISQARANAAVNVMRNQLKLANAMHAVAMGSSTLFGTGRDQYDKNRVVEVWAVLP
ncbi:MAG: OmpA family protein [Verrucomicrobia bacterium]|nr:OmpA family protein [Verrucomicrobiota bacterium]